MLLGAAALLVVLFLTLRAVASVLLDRWWYDTVTDVDVWRIGFVAKLELAVGTGVLTAAVLGSSVWFVLKVGALQRDRPHPAIERYHARMGPGHRWLLVGLAVYLSLHIASAAVGNWQSWLLFQHAATLGRQAPVDGRDVGYHLFRLPFLSAASSYLRQLTAFTLLVTVAGHVASGAIRWPGRKVRSSRLAIAHVAALVAFFCALQALHDVLVARAAIATNRVGTFDGPGYTEATVTRPGLLVAAVVVLLAGFAAVWFGRTGSWRPLVTTLAVAATVHFAVVSVLPALTERFVVAPAEAQRQLWSIEDNLDATTAAYQIDDVTVVDGGNDLNVRASGEPIGGVVSDENRVPLFDSASMASALQVLAGTTGTRISDVDIDRYDLDGENRPVFVAARSARRDDLPERGWVQEHLVYTHGDGVVAVPADRTDVDGRPDTSSLGGFFDTDHVPLYFGDQLDGWYAIVGTRRPQQGDATFDGDGIGLSSFGRRAALALAVGESQPLLSSELTSESELLYRRSVRERVGALAPFLALDGDPYPVLTDGRVTWIIDGYTTSSTSPSSQFVTVSGVPASSDLAGREINYLHASVKATVDAETGETHLYRTDGGDDPILDVWDGVYPGLLEPLDRFPAELAPQVRYPDDLWTVQTALLGRYHVESAEELFNGTERWAVSAAAATSVGEVTTTPAPSVDIFTTLAPVGDGFAAVRPFGPGSGNNPTTTRDELAAVAVAEHGLDATISLVVPDDDIDPPLLSPQVAQSAIDADSDFARVITLLNANGSKVLFGPMAPVVNDDGLVWTRPVIVLGTGSSAAPRLFGVAAVVEGRVAVRATTPLAVAAARDPDAPSVDPTLDAGSGGG